MYIGELATSEAAEGRGVGQALAQACEQWGREQGYRILSLATGAANSHALGFYRHMSYLDEDIKLVKLLWQLDLKGVRKVYDRTEHSAEYVPGACTPQNRQS